MSVNFSAFLVSVLNPLIYLAQIAISRLQKILDTCLLRRKKNTMLDGKRLVELPSKQVILHKLQFTEEEREIYQAVSLFFFPP